MRTRFLALTLLAFAGPLLGACADATTPAAKAPSDAPAAVRVRIDCVGDVRAGTLTCRVPDAETGGSKDVILGSQHVNVTLTSSNVAVAADTFGFDLTVRNLLNMAIGTTDGATPDPNGVRVFIANGITTTGGTGTVTLADADGVGIFTASNQPYIAYHQIIPAGTVSAPRRWKMQFDPGVLNFSFVLLVDAPFPPSGSTTVITVVKPAANAIVHDSVPVQIATTGPALASATVEVGGRVLVLPVGSSLAGTLRLNGLAPGPYTLHVRAVDVNGDTTVASVPVTYDDPPRLIINSPLEGEVARGPLNVDIDCVDDMGCTHTFLWTPPGNQVHIMEGTTGLHGTFTVTQWLAPYTKALLPSVGWDADSQSVVGRRNVYVDTTAALVAIASAGVQMYDADSTRSLYRDSTKTVWLDDRVAGTHQRVMTNADSAVGYLHPWGAILANMSPTEGYGQVIEFHGGAAHVAGPGRYLRVEGGYAAWSSQHSVYRCDLATGTVTVVSTVAESQGRVDVAANGDVVFADSSDRKILRYSGGTTTTLVYGPAFYFNYDPVTDGTNVLFRTTTTRSIATSDWNADRPIQTSGRMAVWHNGTEEYLTPQESTPMLSGVNYDANGGWIAYPAVDASGFSQVRTRSPDGVDRAATHGTYSVLLRGLGSDGTVAVSNAAYYGPGDAILRSPYVTATPFEPYGWGTLRFRNAWLTFDVGRTAFTASY